MKTGHKCPACGQFTDYSLNNKWRPFCSERCKLIDLGDWIEGKNRIPAEEHAHQIPEDEEINIRH